MKATGKIKIKDIELQDPNAEIVGVYYDWKNEIVKVDVQFWELSHRHERTFEYPSTPNMNEAQIKQLILDELTDFTE